MTPKPSPMIKANQDISTQNRTGQAADYGAAQGTLSQFEGPVNQSPFYKAMLGAGTDATTRAYQSAQSNIRSRAKSAGFGYNQPVAQGAEGELQGREVGALAELPGKTMVQAAGPAMEAARDTAGMGTELGREGVGYQGQAGTLEEQYQQQKAAASGALWKALAGAATIPIGKSTITV